MSLKYNNILIPRVKELRKNMTPQEKRLWYEFLREYPIRFQRQKAIGHYIADFYCHRAKLIIELDGSQHYTDDGEAHDEKRTIEINKYKFEVLRFSNIEITEKFQECCECIHLAIEKRIGCRIVFR
ncbi:MAG: endonuclease domain-containing protein [Pseudomonadota bacterium]